LQRIERCARTIFAKLSSKIADVFSAIRRLWRRWRRKERA
jgi:hypothetical protein